MLMFRFKLQAADVGSNRSVNCPTYVGLLQRCQHNYIICEVTIFSPF